VTADRSGAPQKRDAAWRRAPGARIARLALKELRETLRDRRTIATLVLMPILVYPLLSVAFQRFLVSNFHNVAATTDYVIGLRTNRDAKLIGEYLMRGNAILNAQEHTPGKGSNSDAASSAPPTEPAQPDRDARSLPMKYEIVEDVPASVADGRADLGIDVQKTEPFPRGGDSESAIDCELTYDASSPLSRDALHWVESRLGAVNEQSLAERLQAQEGHARRAPISTAYRSIKAVAAGRPPAQSLATLVPLILILMTITGAVYPAIDLTAGERERGTLEMLIAAPVPRMQLLLAKYIAVLFVAVLTATVNLAAMVATVASMGVGRLLFGDAGMSLGMLADVMALLVLFAAFFSAVLLAVTSFARSFKEAQAYLIPLMLVSIAPGMLSMIPGLKLKGPLAVTPLVNIVLLARDLFAHNVELTTAVWVILSTGLFALAAIGVAARIFGTDAILYGGYGTWADLFRRPTRISSAPTPTSALLCLAVMFPAYFLASNVLAHSGILSLQSRLFLAALITILVFGQIPLAIGVLNRVDLASGFQLRAASPVVFAGAFLLGISIWPFAHEIVVLLNRWDLVGLDAEVLERARELVQKIWKLPPLLLVAALAVVPAICEEFFFRGFLLAALRTSMPPFRAILASSLLFGVFHLIATDQLHFERLVPSTMLGLVLGWVCVRCGSAIPGMLLHATHNSLLLLAARYQKELAGWGWNMGDAADIATASLPASWLIAAVIGTAMGVALVGLGTRATWKFSPNTPS
jgi:ABC-2 type transport system permease protein/sodium transport system permease protein